MDWKEEWKKALLSGEYFQAKGALKYGQSYCCLGVFCEIASTVGFGEWADGGAYEYDETISGCFIPRNLEKELGFPKLTSDVRDASGLEVAVRKIIKSLALRKGMTLDEFLGTLSSFLQNIFNEGFHPDGDEVQLLFSALNDEGATFEEIATLIDYL